jgi:hypothetical protein
VLGGGAAAGAIVGALGALKLGGAGGRGPFGFSPRRLPTGLYIALSPCKVPITYTCTNGCGGACCMSGPSSDLPECSRDMCKCF